jgi:CRISPR-associated protein Cas1
MSLGMTPYGCWLAKTEGNVALRKKQYSYDGTEIAQRLVADKIDHQIRTLSRRRGKSLKLKKAIVQLKGYRGKLPDRKLGLRNILGLEGIASRIYFRNLFDEMRWVRRSPRTKFDITNLLLDIGYTQLFNIVDALLSLYGFDTYQGVYHKTFYQRKSLVCDLVEPFRPLIDYQIRKGYTLGKIQESDFDFLNKQYRIFGKAAAPYLAWTLKPILDNQTEIFLYIQRYYRAFMQDKPIGEFPYFSVKG